MLETRLQEIAKNIRLNILDMITKTNSSHIGSCFSIVDILTVLYSEIANINPKNTNDPQRDIFILSKGHAAVVLYSTLAEFKFFPKEKLKDYAQNGSNLCGHIIKNCLPGIEASTGSLGHGLSMATGFAWAAKKEKLARKIYCLIGDGECNEGSIWEAIMFASHHKLNNLTIIVDFNNQQGMGVSKNIINQDNLSQRFESFNCKVVESDGHDFIQIYNSFKIENPEKPKVIIMKTIKGKGVSFMENNIDWHYKSPNSEQFELAKRELENI